MQRNWLLSISNEQDTNYLDNLNIHPTSHKITESIIDFINHLEWKNIFIFFQEPQRIENLVRLSNGDPLKYNLQFRLLDTSYKENWIYQIRYAKQSGFSHFVVDLDAKYINKFLELVILFNFF